MKIGAVLLAAGKGQRFGGDKLLAELSRRPVIDHVLEAMAVFPFDAAVCVVRPDSRVAGRLDGRVTPVVNAQADAGMGTSLAAGIAALPPVDAAFIVLADMPGIPVGLFAQMAGAMTASGADIVVPVRNGQQGHPVLFAKRCFSDLMALTGDTGARSVVRSGAYAVVTVGSGDPGILRDIDVPGDLDEF